MTPIRCESREKGEMALHDGLHINEDKVVKQNSNTSCNDCMGSGNGRSQRLSTATVHKLATPSPITLG